MGTHSSPPNRESDRERGQKTDRQTDRQTDSQPDRQTDRQTDLIVNRPLSSQSGVLGQTNTEGDWRLVGAGVRGPGRRPPRAGGMHLKRAWSAVGVCLGCAWVLLRLWKDEAEKEKSPALPSHPSSFLHRSFAPFAVPSPSLRPFTFPSPFIPTLRLSFALPSPEFAFPSPFLRPCCSFG